MDCTRDLDTLAMDSSPVGFVVFEAVPAAHAHHGLDTRRPRTPPAHRDTCSTGVREQLMGVVVEHGQREQWSASVRRGKSQEVTTTKKERKKEEKRHDWAAIYEERKEVGRGPTQGSVEKDWEEGQRESAGRSVRGGQRLTRHDPGMGKLVKRQDAASARVRIVSSRGAR